MMERSGRFMSLSGFSGILIGIFALCYGFSVRYHYPYFSMFNQQNFSLFDEAWQYIYFYGGVLCFASILLGIILTVRKSKKSNLPLFTSNSKSTALALFVPLSIGGLALFNDLLLYEVKHFFPYTLIFYGIGLFAAAAYTLKELRALGLLQIALGLIALFYPGSGLFCWMLGFGLLHVVYGLIMHFKYDRAK